MRTLSPLPVLVRSAQFVVRERPGRGRARVEPRTFGVREYPLPNPLTQYRQREQEASSLGGVLRRRLVAHAHRGAAAAGVALHEDDAVLVGDGEVVVARRRVELEVAAIGIALVDGQQVAEVVLTEV